MNPLQKHEISEANHRILNPFTDEKLALLGEICRLDSDRRVLDLACGKGEMLSTWAARYGLSGVGVDISEVFLDSARLRAAELGVTDRVEFRQADASQVLEGESGYDVVSCIGATWIGGGLVGTIALLRPYLRPGGLMLIGEPYWRESPPAEACAALGISTEDSVDLPGTLDRFESAGMRLAEMVLADEDSWDRYAAAQWWTLLQWLDTNPDHPDRAELTGFLEESRRAHLAYGRRYLGWGVFVLRP